jgi:hypothetical protein
MQEPASAPTRYYCVSNELPGAVRFGPHTRHEAGRLCEFYRGMTIYTADELAQLCVAGLIVPLKPILHDPDPAPAVVDEIVFIVRRLDRDRRLAIANGQEKLDVQH